MISRSRFLITADCVCHLLLAVPLVTSQLLSQSTLQFPSTAGLMPPEFQLQLPANPGRDSADPQGVPRAPSPLNGEEVTIRARSQEKAGDIFKLRGEVQINFRNYVLRADEITYNSATGDVVATGHVVLDGGPNDEHVEASHGTYNTETEKGTF